MGRRLRGGAAAHAGAAGRHPPRRRGGEATLVDVRETRERDAGHLRDAALLPLSRLRGGVPADELVAAVPRGRPVYTYCGAGGRSLIAAAALKRHGYDARPLRQGFDELARAGFPLAGA